MKRARSESVDGIYPGKNGNQFRDDEIIILEQLRDGKMVKNIFPKMGESL